jgi:hypothetical protein
MISLSLVSSYALNYAFEFRRGSGVLERITLPAHYRDVSLDIAVRVVYTIQGGGIPAVLNRILEGPRAVRASLRRGVYQLIEPISIERQCFFFRATASAASQHTEMIPRIILDRVHSFRLFLGAFLFRRPLSSLLPL